jgi:hypothetical protein
MPGLEAYYFRKIQAKLEYDQLTVRIDESRSDCSSGYLCPGKSTLLYRHQVACCS